MKYVNLFFHIYQPPVQDEQMLGRVVDESYGPLTRIFLKFPDLKFTLNINFSLFEQLNANWGDIVADICSAYELNVLELTGSAAYHAILPLLDERDVERQLKRNTEGIDQLLQRASEPTGDLPRRAFQPEGVFPPEMALSTLELCPVFQKLEYKWTITDDGVLGPWGIDVPFDEIYEDRGIAVFLRSNVWSNQFAQFHGQWRNGAEAVAQLEKALEEWIGPEKDGYIIIALDGETFGHHHPELGEEFLVELFEAFRNSKTLQLAHLADLYQEFPRKRQFIPPGSWSIDAEDIRNGDFFAMWKSARNRVHVKQWEFTEIVRAAVRRHGDDGELARSMDRALFSCQYWWASFWKFEPGEIYRGAFNMMRLFQRAVRLPTDTDLLERGEAVFRELVTEVEKEAADRKAKSHG